MSRKTKAPAKSRKPTRPRKPGTRAGVPNVDTETITRALAEWVRVGSSEEAAERVGVEPQTVRKWRTTHPAIWREVVRSHAEALRLIGDASGMLLARGIRDLAAKLNASLADGTLPPEQWPQAMKAMVAARATEDRIYRLDEKLPTDIVEHDDRPDAELRRRFEELTSDERVASLLTPAART